MKTFRGRCGTVGPMGAKISVPASGIVDPCFGVRFIAANWLAGADNRARARSSYCAVSRCRSVVQRCGISPTRLTNSACAAGERANAAS